jgi:hypothetical protein
MPCADAFGLTPILGIAPVGIMMKA